MDILSLICLIIGTLLFVIGLVIIAIAIFGVYRFNYILNRMHVAATCDTLALFIMLIGLIFLNGISFTTLKLVTIIIFFWLTSPICSHLISKVEKETNESINEECEVVKR